MKLITIVQGLAVICCVILSAANSQATILNVGPGGKIINPPSSVGDNGAGSTGYLQLGFDERQSVLLERDIQVDGGIIKAGTIVDSHMIFLNQLLTDTPNTPGSGLFPIPSALLAAVDWDFSGTWCRWLPPD